MAFANVKLLALLMQSEEGKDILENIANKSQEEFEKELEEFFSENGKGACLGKEYQDSKKVEVEEDATTN